MIIRKKIFSEDKEDKGKSVIIPALVGTGSGIAGGAIAKGALSSAEKKINKRLEEEAEDYFANRKNIKDQVSRKVEKLEKAGRRKEASELLEKAGKKSDKLRKDYLSNKNRLVKLEGKLGKIGKYGVPATVVGTGILTGMATYKKKNKED